MSVSNSGPWRPSRATLTFTNAETGERETTQVQSEMLTNAKLEDHPALFEFYRRGWSRPTEVAQVPDWPPATLEGIGKRVKLPIRLKYMAEWKFGYTPLPGKQARQA